MSASDQLPPNAGRARRRGASRLLRQLTGGEGHAARMLRGLLWQRRARVAVVLLLSLCAALLDGSTLAVFTLALETLTGEPGPSVVRRLGTVGQRFDVWRASEEPEQVFLVLIGIAIASQILRSVLELSAKTLSARVVTDLEGELRRRTFGQFLAMRYSAISRFKVGDLSAYLGQVPAVSSVVGNLYEGLYQVLSQGAYVVVLLIISWKMTLVAGVLLGVIVFGLRGLLTRIKQASRSLVRSSTAINASAVELLDGIRHLHTYGREQYAAERVGREIESSLAARYKGQVLGAILPTVMQTMATLGVAAILVAGTRLPSLREEVSLAALLSFVLVLYRLMPRIVITNNKLALIYMNWGNVERVAEILRRDDKEYLRSGRLPFRGLREGIAFRDVTLEYEPGAAAVERLTFDVPRGTMTALVGPSGAGKSTVVNLLLRLYDATSGQILVDGTPLSDLRIRDWRGAIGLVDQDPFILHDSVRENIRFGKLDASDDEIRAAARVAAADGFINELPSGYETVVGVRGQRLSGGQRQRIAIARAVVRGPSLLVLDEATSALDSASERAIQCALEELRRQFTVVAIAHRLSTIAMADQILVLDQGRVVERGNHAELLELGGIYARLWHLQARDGGE